MRLRRHRVVSQPTGRQKLRSNDLTPSPPAFTYRAQRSQDHTAASVTPSRSFIGFWLQRFGLIILFVAVAASLINALSLSSSVKVVLLGDTSQAFLRPVTVYQQAADRQLTDSIWNRNKITVDTNALSRSLLKQFPELSDVSITVPLLAHRPLVYVQPAQPALILISGNGSFVIGSNGKALLTAADASAPTKLPVVDNQAGLKVRLNQQALSADNVSFIETVIGELAAKQFAVSGMTLPAGGAELDVHVSGQPYFVKFNLESSNARGEAGTFLATINQLHHQNVTPSQYVDVRVDGRAYYK